MIKSSISVNFENYNFSLIIPERKKKQIGLHHTTVKSCLTVLSCTSPDHELRIHHIERSSPVCQACSGRYHIGSINPSPAARFSLQGLCNNNLPISTSPPSPRVLYLRTHHKVYLRWIFQTQVISSLSLIVSPSPSPKMLVGNTTLRCLREGSFLLSLASKNHSTSPGSVGLVSSSHQKIARWLTSV